MGALLAEPPSRPDPNAWVGRLRQQAEGAPALAREALPATVDRLNAALQRDAATRAGLWAILTEVGKMPPKAIADQTIDVEKLSDLTVRMLGLYLAERAAKAGK
jgi:hypothetical protein